jgi:hypothetical protein
MRTARRPVAARYAAVALLVSWAVRAAPAGAEGAPQLLLPLVAVITAAQVTGTLPGGAGIASRPARYGHTIPFLPRQLQIPDTYADAEQDFVTIDRSRPPIDADRYVWVDLLPRRQRGWMASVAYDQESRGPLSSDDDLLSVVLEYHF